ncbi:MAG: circularly permuted type 2 ATP-grasp protein [Spirochaetia bacterium]|nr:circularly permuted type 2 ATP-grasp protein [Spirochaetia bacterium]
MASQLGSILDGYTGTGARDEFIQPDGKVRPQWDFLLRAMEAMGHSQLSFRQEEIRRFIEENGVTYNVYDEAGGKERPWPLDVLPVLIDSREWASVERGLIQRAELFELILQDLYGPAKLLSEGLLPPQIIFDHGGFLRSCVGLNPLGKRSLHLYAADLARGSDGSFSVIADLLQAPSGAGYALENRIVLSRTMPSLYRDSHVHRLAVFFRALRNHLATIAGGGNRIVLLTPGPDNETYFEQAFLANYLGFNLVQGSDLTVRDGKVYLKTLSGLRPIDGIFRRIDDAYSDPLELKTDSLLGVAGLLYSMRQNSVAVMNPPGAGVLENPGIYPFLPGICRHLLGQDLRLANTQTYWCGNSLSHVLDRLPELVIKPISRGWERGSVFGGDLSSKDLASLAERIRAKPTSYVAQERHHLSTTPLWTGNKMEPRSMVIRSFACTRDDSYMVMPGGLVRVAPDANSMVVSNQKGGVSKDLWILASEPEKQISLLSATAGTTPIVRSGGEIPSRAADNLFWLGRYAERTESLVRIMREIQLRLVEMQGLLAKNANSPEVEQKLRGIFFDAAIIGGLRFNVRALTNAARSLRERLSEDTWRTINRLETELDSTGKSPFEILENLLIYLASFAGFVSESMTRGQGFRFLEFGRRIERATQSADLIVSVSKRKPPEALWEHVLKIQNSYMTYRRRYKTRMDPSAVIDLIIFDLSNPRSLGHQLTRLEELAKGLPGAKESSRTVESKTILHALSVLRLAEGTGPKGDDYSELQQLMYREKQYLRTLSETITSNYFNYIETQHRLEGGEWSVTG